MALNFIGHLMIMQPRSKSCMLYKRRVYM